MHMYVGGVVHWPLFVCCKPHRNTHTQEGNMTLRTRATEAVFTRTFIRQVRGVGVVGESDSDCCLPPVRSNGSSRKKQAWCLVVVVVVVVANVNTMNK